MMTPIVFCAMISSEGYFEDGRDDGAFNSGDLTTPDLARLFSCCVFLTSGLQFVLTASRDPNTSPGHIEMVGDPDFLARMPTLM